MIDMVKPTINLWSLITQNKNQNVYLYANHLYGYAMSRFLPTSGFKWMDPEEFDLNKYTSNSWKGCVFEVDLQYPKESRELHNDYPLAPDKTEIKREMLSEYQLNIPIGNVKRLVPNSFDKKSTWFIMKTYCTWD